MHIDKEKDLSRSFLILDEMLNKLLYNLRVKGKGKNMIITIFIGMQVGIIGLCICIHFLIGLKRGLAKTSWYFLMNIMLVILIFLVIGWIPIHFFISEDMAYNITRHMISSNAQMTDMLESLFDAGAFEIVVAFADFIGKMVLFFLLYWVCRWLFMKLLAGFTWRAMTKNSHQSTAKKKISGGLVGILRGAFTGVIALLPILVVTNSLVNQKMTDGKDSFDPIVAELIAANEYNIIKPLNLLKVGHTGLADATFDLAFSTRIKNYQIKWRAEFAWLSEAALISYDLNQNHDDDFNFTAADLKAAESFFTKLSESELLNFAVAPTANYGFSMVNQGLNLQREQKFFNQVSAQNINLNKDVLLIYSILGDLLEVADYKMWQTIIKNPNIILEFEVSKQQLLKGALNKVFDLEILTLVDIALETFVYHDSIQNLVNWEETEENKNRVIDDFVTYLKTYEGKFVASTGKEALNVLLDMFFDFPQELYINESHVTFLGIIFGQINPLTISDDHYHQWLQGAITNVSNMTVMDYLMEPGMQYVSHIIEKQMDTFTEAELSEFVAILEKNFSTVDDLNRELTWVTGVYEKLTQLYALKHTDSNDILTILDEILPTAEGQIAFDAFLKQTLEGQTISNLTQKLSSALVKKYLIEPVSLAEPMQRAVGLENFDFEVEINVVKDFVLDLYKAEGFSLTAIMTHDNPAEFLMPYVIDYLNDNEHIDRVLASNIVYSLIDYNLSNTFDLVIPQFVREKIGTHQNWIKKEEIKMLFEIISSMNLDLNAFFSNDAENSGKLVESMLLYTKEEINREKVLDSDILYYQMHTALTANNLDLVPSEALIFESGSPYDQMIKKEELSKLLNAIGILEILNLEDASSLLNLETLTNDKLSRIVGLESLVINSIITKQINQFELLNIPISAYTNQNKEYLKTEELSGMVDMLNVLHLNALDLSDLNNVSVLLSKIYIKDFINVGYHQSLIIRSFVTTGIKETIKDMPKHIYDDESLLLSDEITELFSALAALDEGTDTLDSLASKIDPLNLTFGQVNQVMEASDSLIIRYLISKEFLAIEQIKALVLLDDVYDSSDKTILSSKEFKALIHALDKLKDSEEDVLINSLMHLKVEEITLSKVESMFNQESEIIRYLISNELSKETSGIAIEPNTIENGYIKRNHLEQLLNVLVLSIGENKKISALNNIYQTLTIKQLKEIILSPSVMIKHLFTKNLDNALGWSTQNMTSYITIDILDSDYEMLTTFELSNITEALYVIADNDENMLVYELVDKLSNLNLSQVRNILEKNSEVFRKKVSDEIRKTLTDHQIYSESIDLDGYIYAEELSNLTNAFGIFIEFDIPLSDALGSAVDNIEMIKIKDALAEGSQTFRKMVSNALDTAHLTTSESYENSELVQIDEIENLADALQALGIDDIYAANENNGDQLLAKMVLMRLNDSDGTLFAKYIDRDEPEEMGLTILKSYLIKKINSAKVQNRVDLFEVYMNPAILIQP